MITTKTASAVLFMILMLAGFTSAQVKGIEHVIVIGVDGMSPDGILGADAPNMVWLMENGASTFHARAVRPTSSSSNWASMIMGVPVEQHGITSNGWERNNFTIKPTKVAYDDIFPTIFSELKTQKPDLVIGAVYDWDGFGRLFQKKAVDFDIHGEGAEGTTQKAIEIINTKKPNFLFVHLDLVDGAGHKYGHGSKEYYAAVSKADKLAGEIIEALKANNIFDKSIIIVSADHGGINKGHGGDTMAELEIPFIIYGEGINKGVEITSPVNTYDNACTVGYIFGFKQPYEWTGRPVYAAFTKTEADFLKQYTRPLVFPPKMSLRGATFFEEQLVVSVKSFSKDANLYYTLDGQTPDKNSNLYADPIKIDKSTVLKTIAITSKGNASNIMEEDYTLASKDNGVNYSYYEGSWETIPDFSKLTPTKKGRAAKISLKEYAGKKDSNYGLVVEGFIKIDKEGDYNFYTISDDGSKLFIDGNLVVDNDGMHGATEKSGKINLSAGKHKLTLHYIQGGGDEVLKLLFEGPGFAKKEVGSSDLFITE